MAVDLEGLQKADHAAADEQHGQAVADGAGEESAALLDGHQVGHEVGRGVGEGQQSDASQVLIEPQLHGQNLDRGRKAKQADV